MPHEELKAAVYFQEQLHQLDGLDEVLAGNLLPLEPCVEDVAWAT